LNLSSTLATRDPAYNRLKNRLIAETGLSFYANRDHELTDLIGQRLAALRLRDCASYAALLDAGGEGETEMDVLIGKLTIGETSFFRDPEQFAAIRDIVLPHILERKQESKQLRIWSAGCATGAEPYSLAIMLERDLAARIDGWRIDIVATDLNRNYLARAAEGIFRAWALRSVSDEVRRDCFLEEGATWKIHPRYKQWISFHYKNLVGSGSIASLAAGDAFDLILCRNVMIYFTAEVNRRLIGQFHDCLEYGGWLVVGASEHNQEYYKAFRAVRPVGTKLYQKAPYQAKPVPLLPQKAPEPRPPPAEPLIAAAQAPETASLKVLRELVDCGDWEGAAEIGQQLLTQDKLNAAIYFYQAMIFENLGIPNAAERSLRQAIYLDRNFAMAHYHLGLALKRDGQMAAAARSFGNVLRILEGIAAPAQVMDGVEISASALKELAGMHLEGSKA
jgi:chemotaxis protein methyltransferase CheR